MSGRDSPRGPDPDDWFTPPDGAQPRRSGTHPSLGAEREATSEEWTQPAAFDDWLDDQAAAERDPRDGRRQIGRRGVALAAGAGAVVILIVGLAVGGVFSGSKQPAATTTAQARTTNQTPTTQPTPPTPAVVPPPATTLKPGDQGAQVKLLQRALARLGYTTGPADGDYGPSTQKALTRFQRTSAIAADGVLGPKTLAALKQALLAHG